MIKINRKMTIKKYYLIVKAFKIYKKKLLKTLNKQNKVFQALFKIYKVKN